MDIDMRKRRRQVAWICFESLLTEDQLLKAIQLLEHSYQVDSINSMVAYVTRICNEHDISSDVRKSLYSQFHNLMTEETGLLIDPLSLLQEKEQLKTPTQAVVNATASTGIETSPPAPVAAASVPPPAAAKPPERNVPIHVWMFAYFVGQLIFYLPNKYEFYEALSELSKNRKFATKKIDMQVSQWLIDTQSFEWSEHLSEKNLAEIIHLIYTVLCEILGPIGADESFHKALAQCEQTPQARQFSPSRFL